jgi:beta-galactosidase
MNVIRWLILGAICLPLFECKQTNEATIVRETKINIGWKFTKDSVNSDFSGVAIDDSKWELVTLPHTPQIEPLVMNKQWQGIAWYRKHLDIEKNDTGKKIFLKFEGAMQVADVWVNGNHKITHFGGYLPFTIDISDIIKGGDNVIAVKLDNRENQEVPPGKPINTLDFYFYGGLYRDVDLIETDKLHINETYLSNRVAGGGIFVNTEKADSTSAVLSVKTEVKNEYKVEKAIKIRQTLLNKEGKEIVSKESEEITLASEKSEEITQNLDLTNPTLWSTVNPFLYTLKTEVLLSNQTVDVIETSVGIRKIELKNDGFYLNGKKFFIRGTNRHQEYPYIGYALSDEAQYRDAVKIKSAGFDFVRCSHYPQSEAFLNACDELGILVMDCIPGWQFMGDSVFRKNSLNDCRNLVRRDRNHPSIVFWEVSLNETDMDTAFMDEQNRILREEMPYQVYSAGWKDYPAYNLFIPARQHATPPDYWNNYKPGERPLFIAEYGDWEYYAQNAGFNQTEFKNLKEEERTSRQFRGDGEKRMIQQSLNYQEAINSNQKGKYLVGEANWLMFDYNRGYSPDIEASGISDIFRIPKFSYYFFQSQRRPVNLNLPGIQSGPMVHIASYWQQESPTAVKIFSNCEEVELYLNNRIITRQKADKDNYSTNLDYPPFTFNITKFEKGTLIAKGFIQGKEAASDTVRTPEEPNSIALSYDLSGKPLSKDGKDVVFVYAKLTDKNGTLCSINGTSISFSVEGGGKLIGDNPAKTEAGIATILVETAPGKVPLIKVTAKGFSSSELKIQ